MSWHRFLFLIADTATATTRRRCAADLIATFFFFLVVPNPGKGVYHYRVLLLTVPHN
jgi:hypothetical protein